MERTIITATLILASVTSVAAFGNDAARENAQAKIEKVNQTVEQRVLEHERVEAEKQAKANRAAVEVAEAGRSLLP